MLPQSEVFLNIGCIPSPRETRFSHHAKIKKAITPFFVSLLINNLHALTFFLLDWEFIFGPPTVVQQRLRLPDKIFVDICYIGSRGLP